MSPLPFDLPAVVVLIGPAGSGKSQAAAAFPPEWRLSLDDCRRLVADDAGDQDATGDAVAVFDQVLAARLTRRLTTVVDATNTEAGVRASLLQRARRHQLPAVAVTLRTSLELCQARQFTRPANRKVPADAIARQHAAFPSREQLLNEGFAQAYDAADLDLLRMVLLRATEAKPDRLADVRAAFGLDLAAVYIPSVAPDADGTIVVAGREVTVRVFDGEYATGFEARLDDDCLDCGGPLWVRVNDASDLLWVYNGGQPDEPMCDQCD